MKDWRRLLENGSIEIEFQAMVDDLFPDVPDDGDELDPDSDEAFDRYETAKEQYNVELQRDLRERVSAIGVHTEPPEEDHVMGGAPPPDFIYLLIEAAAAYASLRVIVDDIRSVMKRMRERNGPYVGLPEELAMMVAWDHVAPPGSHSVVEVKYAGPIRPVTENGFGVAGGWLIGVDVDGRQVGVIIGHDGVVLAEAPGFDAALLGPAEMPIFGSDES